MIPAPPVQFVAAPIDWSILTPRSMPPPAPPRRALPPAEAERLRRYREELDSMAFEEREDGRYNVYYLPGDVRDALLAKARRAARRGRHVPGYSRTARMAEFRQTHRDLMLMLQGRSIVSVAAACGMHRRQVWLILLGAWDPGNMQVRTIARLARGMQVDLAELLKYLTDAHKQWKTGNEPRSKAKAGRGGGRKAATAAGGGSAPVHVPRAPATT